MELVATFPSSDGSEVVDGVFLLEALVLASAVDADGAIGHTLMLVGRVVVVLVDSAFWLLVHRRRVELHAVGIVADVVALSAHLTSSSSLQRL